MIIVPYILVILAYGSWKEHVKYEDKKEYACEDEG